MRLPTEMQQMQLACERAVKDKISVEICPVHFNLLGLPRTGKTTFLLRLLGVIIDISWYAKTIGPYMQSSTGAAEDGGQIILQLQCSDMATISSETWHALDPSQEAVIIGQLLHLAMPPVESSTTRTSSRNSPASTTSDNSGLDDILSAINEALQAEDLEKVKLALDKLTLVTITDIGGQAEFLDLQASLIQGPSFNLLFSRLVDKLDDQFDEYYTSEKGESTEKASSITTKEEALFQVLSTIACFSGCFSEEESLQASAEEGQSDSKMMFIGSYRDKVSEEEFKEADQLLEKKIRNTKFFDMGIVEYATEKQLMLAVDNMSGGEKEIKEIRGVLERIIGRSFKKISIPAAWLLFNLKMRRMNRRTMSLKECQELAGQLRMSSEDLQQALWFLHHRVGSLLYYPEVEALKEIVICQRQVVFDSATNLIKNTFTYNKVGKIPSEMFQKRAQFSMKDVNTAMSNYSSELSPEKLVQLLQFLGILTLIPSSSGIQPTYFMPCVLKSAPASELRPPSSSKQDPIPLMIRYDCGYVPVGVFPSMITNLVSFQQAINWGIIWEGLRKNRVQFHILKDCDVVTLISHPRFFEIAITRPDDCTTSAESLCSHVRSVIQSTLVTVTSRMNYKFTMSYKFGFECPKHPRRDHLCVLANKSANRILCLENMEKQVALPMLSQHKVWFASNSSPGAPRVSSSCVPFSPVPPPLSVPSLYYLHLLKWQDEQGREQTFHLVNWVSAKWKQFGILLKLELNQLDAIGLEYSGRTTDCWNKVMEHWRLGCSPDYPATWMGLYSLLRDMEYGVVADKLEAAVRMAC